MATERLSKAQARIVWKEGFEATWALISEFQDRITALEKRQAELERRLGLNSRNSSKPPSSDASRPAPKSQRTKSGKKPGGQAGHPGHTLYQRRPDEVHWLQLPSGPLCPAGCTRTHNSRLLAPEVRQVADLPPLSLHISEYRAERVRGACGRIHHAAFPAGVSAPMQYGPRLKAVALYLSAYQLLPQARTCQALADLCGASMSEGMLNRLIGEAHRKLEPTEQAIEAALSREAVLGLDETGCFLSGVRLWQHSVSAPLYTHYGVHARRGLAGTERCAPFLVHFTGVTVHDGWKPYFQLPEAQHALCNAHHLRELEGFAEHPNQRWAAKMQHLLRRAKREADEARHAGLTGLPLDRQQRLRRRYRQLLAAGFQANPPPEGQPSGKRGRAKGSPAWNLLTRLQVHEQAVLAFITDFSIPFDNNLTERDLRMTKVKQKISGGFRSPAGADAFFRIRGVISTMRKQGQNVLDQLIQAFDPSTPPILLPQT
jgi:transposase